MQPLTLSDNSFKRDHHPMAEDSPNIRIMVVDDSVTMRGLYIRVLGSEMGLQIAASVGDGLEALEKAKRMDVDVVLLDIEMPRMDGLAALPKILEINPVAKVIIVSAHTHAKALVTVKALEMGAVDFIQKPVANDPSNPDASFERELIDKVKAWGDCAKQEKLKPRQRKPVLVDPNAIQTRAIVQPEASFTLRKSEPVKIEAVAIGCSTGGPQALTRLMKGLKGLRQPIFITQHMPAAFTTAFAGSLSSSAEITCYEAKDGMAVDGGKAYLAPGGYHMCAVKNGDKIEIRLNQDPPENFCRPAVDVMLRSLSSLYGASVLTIILTGMGADGLKGCEIVAAKGSPVIAQDKETSVVWGMPGVVAQAGLCNAVLPINQIADMVNLLIKKGGG